jgi:mTERF domain-containing protein, mitochondrial
MKPLLPHLLFWRELVGNCDQGLLKLIQKNATLIKYDIDKHVVLRVNLLNEYGFSNEDIVKLLGRGYCYFIGRSMDVLKQILQYIEELGIPGGSRMFVLAFKSVGSYKKDILVRKVEFFKISYGWSQEEVSSAFKKLPSVFALSPYKVKTNMNYLVQKAMMEPRSIASQPLLLAFSLEKRLLPRHNVMSILAAKGMMKNWSLTSACCGTEKEFLEKFVEPYKKDMPELADAYFAAATAGSIPV